MRRLVFVLALVGCSAPLAPEPEPVEPCVVAIVSAYTGDTVRIALEDMAIRPEELLDVSAWWLEGDDCPH